MAMAGGDSAVGGALDCQEWCHLFSLQPLHLTKNSFGFHQHPQMLKLHILLLMDIVIFNVNSVTLPIWQRNTSTIEEVSVENCEAFIWASTIRVFPEPQFRVYTGEREMEFARWK